MIRYGLIIQVHVSVEASLMSNGKGVVDRSVSTAGGLKCCKSD